MLQAAADQTICLHPNDDVVIARAALKGIPAGHKMAVREGIARIEALLPCWSGTAARRSCRRRRRSTAPSTC